MTALTLVGYCAGYLAILAALGSGPALALGRSLLPTPPLLLAPCIGVSLASAGLVAVWPWMTMHTAAWAILLPACCVSLSWAALSVWRQGFGDLHEAAIPGLFAAVGVVMAILPALLRATLGPTTLFVYDAWGYIPIDQWMRDEREGTALTPFIERWDLSGAHGFDATQHGARVGVSAINGSVSVLFGTSPDQTHLAFMAVLFGLVPVSLWVVARGLGLSRVGAAIGAAFGLSPSLYSMVADSTLANLSAAVLLAPLLLVGGLVAARGGIRTCVLAGILIGGMVSTFPEYLTPTVAVAGIAIVVLVIERVRENSFTRAWLWTLVARYALTIAGVVLVWWVPVRRAELYLSQLTSPDQPAFAGLPPRWLSLSDVGAWAFGVLHLYQLPRFALLSSPREAFAIALPILLSLLAIWGSARLGLWRALLLLAPVAVSIPLALAAQARYQGGNCEYCEWKALTYTLPFLALGVAAGSDGIWHAVRERRDALRIAAIVAGFVPLTGVASLAYANERLGMAVYESPAVLSTDLREVAHYLRHEKAPRRVLIDAPDSDNASPFQMPATYFLLRETPNTYVSFDAFGVAPSYLHPFLLPVPAYYSPNYEYVLTPFAGMATGRRVLDQRANFALEQRRDVDVTIARTGWTLDQNQGSAAIPWIQAPFLLWVASPKAQRVSLHISLDRPLRDHATLTFATASGRSVTGVPADDGASLCVPVPAAAGRTQITVSPQFDAPPPPISRATESDPLPSPSRAIGLAALRADTIPCPPASAVNGLPPVAYRGGWFEPETDPSGTFRWMGTNSTFDVGQVGARHPAVILRSTVSSLVVARRVTVKVAGRLVESLRAVPGVERAFTIRIPAGTGLVQVVMNADPAAGSAAQVNPADHRELAVRIRVLEVVRA